MRQKFLVLFNIIHGNWESLYRNNMTNTVTDHTKPRQHGSRQHGYRQHGGDDDGFPACFRPSSDPPKTSLTRAFQTRGRRVTYVSFLWNIHLFEYLVKSHALSACSLVMLLRRLMMVRTRVLKATTNHTAIPPAPDYPSASCSSTIPHQKVPEEQHGSSSPVPSRHQRTCRCCRRQ